MSMPTAADFDASYADEQFRRSRDPLRRLVKGFYLRNMLRDIEGPTIDFGCGAGQLLRRLPPGSMGIELNPHLVDALRAEGLHVLPAHGDMLDFDLPGFEGQRYRSLVIAHVLEHLSKPDEAILRLLSACRRLGIRRVVAVVPGEKGFRSDRTHRTFIDAAWLRAHPLPPKSGFRLRKPQYFPGPALLGPYFIFHEMKLVLDAED